MKARAHLTAVKGIGPWTADIYLMSSLGRADIWPVGDVALQAAIARALKLKKRPNEKAMETLSKSWRPWRTIAARLFWIHENGLRREKREADTKAEALKANAAKKKKERRDGTASTLRPASGARTRGATHLVVLCHGYGADGNDLIGLAPHWQALLPTVSFVAPNAPEPCAGSPTGYQWFAITRLILPK